MKVFQILMAFSEYEGQAKAQALGPYQERAENVEAQINASQYVMEIFKGGSISGIPLS